MDARDNISSSPRHFSVSLLHCGTLTDRTLRIHRVPGHSSSWMDWHTLSPLPRSSHLLLPRIFNGITLLLVYFCDLTRTSHRPVSCLFTRRLSTKFISLFQHLLSSLYFILVSFQIRRRNSACTAMLRGLLSPDRSGSDFIS